jgi:hypothetical protein
VEQQGKRSSSDASSKTKAKRERWKINENFPVGWKMMFITFYKLLCKLQQQATYDSLIGIKSINFEMVCSEREGELGGGLCILR